MTLENNRVGILGAGQLALMLAESYENEDISFICADKEDSCAFDKTVAFTKDLNDHENLKEFCSMIDVVTFDSEFMGSQFADAIKDQGINVYPSKSFVELSGDRFAEKTELNRLGIETAKFIKIDEKINSNELLFLISKVISTNELSEIGIVIKTRHGGYDGKGQWVLTKNNNEQDLISVRDEIINLTNDPGLIIEGMVDFDFECSIIASRSINGEMATWPLIHNIHKNSILDLSRCPISKELISEDDLKAANRIVTSLCNEHNYVGTICVELFKTKAGIVVNEIAPRVHNSGHLTIEGSKTSQFRNHINAIRGVELGSTDMLGFCAMFNIVGFEPNEKTKELTESLDNVYFHWYNKEVKLKRKVGHITIVAKTAEELEELIVKIQDTF